MARSPLTTPPHLPHCAQVERVATLYPGRAAMAPLLDLLITLLHWGAAGWRGVLQERERVYLAARAALQRFARQQGERVLETPGNPISLALSLATLRRAAPGVAQQEQAAAAEQQAAAAEQQAEPAEQQAEPGEQQAAATGQPLPATFLGAMLFNRCVSGTRVVARGKHQDVGGLCFEGYGAHCDAYPCDYLTVAAALGTTEADVEELLRRLGACLAEFRRRAARDPACPSAV